MNFEELEPLRRKDREEGKTSVFSPAFWQVKKRISFPLRSSRLGGSCSCFLLLFASLFFLLPQAISALEVPKLKGRVNDYADMLSPSTEQQLDAALREFERTDSTQIVVLTIPSLEGDSLRFGALATTMMAGPPELMEQEQRVLAALGHPMRVAAGDGGDVLLVSEGGTLLLRPAPADGEPLGA